MTQVVDTDKVIPVNGRINSKFLINCGQPLHGRVKITGAKNAATKLLAASMLSGGKSSFHNVPNKISDLAIAKEICTLIGSTKKKKESTRAQF